MYDCIVIGAGPAGVFSALSAGKRGKKVLLIERNDKLGEKLKISGGGRCNITNLKSTKDFISNLPHKNGRFLYSALNSFSPYDIVEFFSANGVNTKTADNDRVFPVSDNSNDFIRLMEELLIQYGVKTKYNESVTNIIVSDKAKQVKTDKSKYSAKSVVIATGGVTYPHTGSTGDGHKFAVALDHTVTELFPAETPLISNDEFIYTKELQGLSFQDASLSLLNNDGKCINKQSGDLIITHFGLSGPCALRLSQFVYLFLKENNLTEATLSIDFLPLISFDELQNEILRLRDSASSKTLFAYINGKKIPKRLSNYILKKLDLNEILIRDLNNKKINMLVNAIKNLKIAVHGVKPLTKAFVTGGGVKLDEINPKTMESKIVSGIYFVGEVLDLHGFTGGYNITIALSTGFTCGNNL